MKFTDNLKNNLTIALVASVLLLTGCSSKNDSTMPADMDKFYKDSNNSEIINTKSMHKYTLRPYSVFGIKYYPFIANVGDDFRGIASWYGPDFHAKKTSNGEIYNMFAMTAAHKTLPMNTMVKVDNLDNGKSVIVRINDRGPFVRGRIIDLSNKAAHEIDMVRKGTAQVKVTVLGYNGVIENHDAPYAVLPKQEIVKVAQPVPVVAAVVEPLKPLEIKEKVVLEDNFCIQVGAYSKAEGARKTRDDYQRKFNSKYIVEAKRMYSNGRYLFKVFIKGFGDYSQAQTFKDQNGLANAIIVNN